MLEQTITALAEVANILILINFLFLTFFFLFFQFLFESTSKDTETQKLLKDILKFEVESKPGGQ